jgi:hypothetical protein
VPGTYDITAKQLASICFVKSDKNEEHELKVLSTIPDNIEGRGNRVKLQPGLVLVKLDGKTVRRDNELPPILRTASADPDDGPLKQGDDKEAVQCTLELEGTAEFCLCRVYSEFCQICRGCKSEGTIDPSDFNPRRHLQVSAQCT